MPKVTVITTAYNAEPNLRESLDSIYAQSFQDFEIILVDDGSTDGTKSILEEYAAKYDQNSKLLINTHNQGIPFSRNKALGVAKGDYIAIHDADDVSLEYRIEKEVNFLENNDVFVVGGFAQKISQTGEIVGSMIYPPLNTLGAFAVITRFRLNPIIDPSCMYRRDLIIKHGGYTPDPSLRTVLDFELWCRLLCHGYGLANLQEFLIKYRINPNGVTRSENQTMKDSTNEVWAKFKRRNFIDPVFDTKLQEKDIIYDLWNE